MANKKNVETNKKNTEIKNKKSNELEQKKPTQKKKRRLHSHLKVNIPLFQSLMMILPSLAKHAAAESIDNSSDAADQVTANNVTEKDVTDEHSKADSSAVALQDAQASDNDVNSTLSANHAAHGSSSNLVPSHHLSTLSHPQVHYIPSVSMPTISSGSNGQPTHSNAPTTPALPVTFMPEVIKGTYGELHVDANGQYTFVLNPNSPQYILLNQHQPGTDHFALHLSNGSSIIVQIPVTGKQDTPNISGDLTGVVTEDHNIDSQGLLHANGKIDVIDPDQNENSVTPEVISGKYGSLTIDADGHWQYQVDNSLSNVQALTAATSLHESFTIHTKDGTPQTIDMTIGGNDDNAVITGVDAGTLTEDLTTQVQGQLSVTDSDLGEDHFQASQVTSNFGTLSITKDGAWTYSLDNNNPVVQRLGQGSTATDIVTVHSADGTAHQVMVTINGTNDHAVITSSSANSPSSFFAIGTSNGSSQVTEDKDLTVSGQLNITDIDSKEAHFSNSDLKGTLGTLHLKDNGDWSYDLDNKNPQVQALGQGSTTTDIITIHSADGTPHQIAITVNGTNDKAVISGTSSGAVTEETQLQTSGTLAVTDVDTGEAHFSNTDIVGSFGTLHLTDTGSWTYDLDNTNPNVQALGKGATATDTITVHSADGTPHQVTITVNGTNDAATVSSATVAIDETDKAVTTSGTLTSTDVDNPDNTFTPDSITGSNGDLTIDASGHWVFTANSAFNQLNVGDKVEETFTVTSVDGTPSTIKVTINGTNDAATVSSATVAIDETDKAVTTSGTLTSTDVDNTDNTFTPDSVVGSNGDLTIDANGHWTFTANSAFNQLNVGDKVEETFTVSSVDGTASTIKVTINGTNDKATVSTATVSVDETDKAVTTSGTLTSTDVDNPDNAFTPDSIAGTNGDLTIDGNGHWSFTANSAFNQLNVGDKVEETFTVSSVDGTTSTIKVTINGTNDKATVSSASIAIDETDKAITTSGTLTSTDVDNPDNTFTPVSLTGTHGGLTIDANGHWVFTAGSAFNQLNIGDKVEETFTVSSIDGTPSTIKVTINGTNDKATVSSATVAIDETDKAVTTSGTLTSIDVDNPDNAFTPDSITGTNGNLTIGANGQWTFTANSTFNQLNVGDKVEETFTVSSVDGTPSTIKVTINGTNDAATVSTATVSVDETDKAVTTSGTLTSIDVDNPDNAFTPDSITGTNGNLTIGANGQWTFTANSAFNQLNVGDKVEETFTVTSIDGTPSTIKVTINGTNDAATVSSATVAIDETDKAVTTSGTLTSIDVDNPDNAFTPDSITGTNGNLTIGANGQWTFTANSAFNQLNVGDKVEETFTVSSIDGTPSTIKVTINGTNDKAVISGTSAGVVTEESQLKTSGSLTVTDVDAGQAHFSNTDIAGTLGTLHLTDSGTWTYDLDNKNPTVQALGKGTTATDTITVHSADGTPHQITITVNGTNDAAVITGTTTGNVDEGHGSFGDMSPDYAQPGLVKLGQAGLSADGKLDIVDPDTGESQFDSKGGAWNNSYHGQYGHLILNPDGTWHYHVTVGSVDWVSHRNTTVGTTIDELGENQTLTDTITVYSKDGTSHDIVITIHGDNDRPYISSEVTLSTGTEDTALTFTKADLLANTVDVDANDAGKLSIANLLVDHGSVVDNKDGTYTFTPTKDYNGQVHFSYDVTDAHGGITATGANLHLQATGDAATITGIDQGNVTEDRGYIDTQYNLHFDGKLDIVDPDQGEAQFDIQRGHTYHGIGYDTKMGGWVLLQQDGTYTYTIDNRKPEIQNLGSTETLVDKVTIHSVDGTSHEIQITIHGTNDDPKVSSVTTLPAGTEDTDVVLHASDLLANATDIDHNDAGQLSVANLTADHGKITDNHDGTFTFHPALDYNGKVSFTYDVKDAHAGSTATSASMTLAPTSDAAVITGPHSGDITEDKLQQYQGMLSVHGDLHIIDPDSGEDHFTTVTKIHDPFNSHQNGLIISPSGYWYYSVRNDLVQHMAQGETTDLVYEVSTVDGTTQRINITLHGTNDNPHLIFSGYGSLGGGSNPISTDEDKAVTIPIERFSLVGKDIDHGDALHLEQLSVDHGTAVISPDGKTVLYTPEANFNGRATFTYYIADSHGARAIDPSTGHIGMSGMMLSVNAVSDKAIISGVDTASIIEDHNIGHSSAQKIAVSGSLSVTDPDTGEDHFRFNQFGEKAIHDPFGGDLRITPAGSWGYEVSNSRLQSLAEGEVEKVVYRVYSADHTAHDITITVTGTNDQPTIIATTLAHGTEDTHYQMQASQFGFTDIDSGDTLHSIAITDLPPATQGKFLLDGHDVTAGQQIPTADISKLQFVPAQDFNGDVQFKYTVNDGHTDSQEATNTLHIDAVGDKAVISGVDTGDVYENRNPDMSPDFAQPGMAHLTNSMIHVEGQLTIIDPDTGENSFDSKGIGYTYHGKYGHLILNTDGKWFYGVATGTADVNGGLTTNVGSTIDQLGANETLTDTITIQSKDGTTHDIVITIHGDNDRPYCNSEVQLNSGKEDTQVSLTTQELLANTVDVDANDLGKLTIANLHADHGSIQDNKDGTYTFTPTKDYNGQVHFSYDVKDAHGGVTHTGASTTLAAVDDKTIISGIDHGVATEDIATHMSTNANIMDAVDWQALQVTDVDSPNTQVTVEFAGKQYTWNIGSNLDVTTPYGKFQFHTIASGSHKGEHSWSYIGDNNNVHVQELKHGESLTESIKLIATDGTEFPITVKVNGTEDGVVIDSNSELGHVVENAQTGASVTGNVVAHDVDLHDTVSWTQTPTGGISGQYGTFHLSADGQWHYDVDQSKATKLGDGDEYWEHFTVEAVSTDGSHVSKSVSVVVHGNNDVPTVSGEVSLPSGKEDTSIHITQAELIANATDVDTNDRGWLHVENLTADHGSLVSNSDGSFTFNPDPNYNGTVNFTYDVADRHGGIAHTRANTSLVAVNDAATFTGDSGSISEDTNIHHNLHTTGSATIPDALFCHGHLIVSDADGHGEAALDLKGQQKISLDGTYGHFDITSTGRWVYKADNNSVPIQDLDNGQTLTDSIEVTSKDGTKHSITVTINGTTDDPVLHSLSDSGVQHSGPVEGNLLTGSGTDQGLSGAATDTDSNAHLVLQDIQIKDPVSGYVAVRPGQPHTMAGIGTLAIEANGHYTFTPEAGFTGKVPSMVYRVGDDGGNPIGDSSQNSLSIEVTPPLQHAPTVTGQTVSTNEDITRTFTTSEFGYSDQDGDTLQFVTISSIPSHGLLLLNGNAVTANQQISKADLDAGHLTFTPITNENGANYAQFTFTANDGHKNSASATMVVDVSAVNDAPIVGSSFISSLEDKPHAFTTADFKYSDIDGDALNHITITNVAHGVLSLNGTTVNVGDDVSASDVSSLIFTPTHNYFSSGVSGLGGVQFTANDGHLDSKEGSILINIASVADPATFSGDSTGVAKEDITLQASGTLTASDPDGTAGFTAVQGGAGIAGSKGYGHAHIDVNGHWTYDLDNNHPIVQQLGEGQTDTETITVQSADGTHHDIVVTITGTNDAPILGVNQTSSTTGTLTETDVDVNDTHMFSVVSSTGQFGSLSVDPNTGDYVYTPNTSITGMSYNSATNSYHGVDVFEVKVSDGHTEDSKFITFDASGHVTMSPTGSLVTSTTVPHQPVVTATQPTLPSGTNVAPTNTVTLDLASTSDSGSSQTDNLTNDTTPTITGHTDIPFSKVTIYDGSTPVGHSVSDASGQYSVSVSSLSDGDHNLSAKALAPSSVMSATSSPLSVHIDTQVHVGIQTDPITADNVINAQESNSSIDITGSVSGDFNTGDIVTLDVNGTQHTGVVDAKGHYSIAVPGSELIADADQKIEASVAVTDTAGNSAHATADVTYQVDTQVSVPTITFENAGADNLYSKAEIARGQANTITATVTPPGDAKIGEHLVVNGQDHVLDAHTLQHGIQIEVHPGSNVQATMTDEHGNTAGSQGFAASAIPEPIIVRPPSGSHQVSGTLGIPPLLPSLTPVPTAQSGWRIHLPNGQYVTSHHGQYGTLTIDPQTGHLHYQEQAQVHTGPHGSASGIGQHEDKFEVALQGSNQDEVVAHVNIQILSHGPGHSGKLTVGTEVVDMTITPLVHTSHPAPPPPPPVQHDEPDMASQADFTVTLSDDSNLDLTQQTHQEPEQKTSHHGAAAYLDALGIKPDATSTTVHDQPADMDIVLAQVDQPDAATHDQAHLDMSDALEHHDANINHNQDDEHHHHNDIDGLPDIDPNS
ncbi:VCBS domain-containing protein [Vibrio splendidus]|uniref:VCBS domain-containing protein n=3 Tax=Vibrio splendidus TaxID=29497 RepID=UPI00076AE367|nr:VCBS domain-containing protein [Vibrio splendidus]